MRPEAQNWYRYYEKCWVEKKTVFLENLCMVHNVGVNFKEQKLNGTEDHLL